MIVYLRFIKPVLGYIIAILGTIVLSPLMLVVAILIKLESPGPVLFKQKRIGKDKCRFMVYKFRTMRVDTPSDMPTHLLQDPKAFITKIGAFLRKSSLDELPQLFNILKGDMLLVGPRPALYNQADLEAARDIVGANALKPGITGYAQVMGRDELPIAVKAGYDGDYVKRVSFLFDIKVIFMTFGVVLHAKGVSEGGPTAKVQED